MSLRALSPSIIGGLLGVFFAFLVDFENYFYKSTEGAFTWFRFNSVDIVDLEAETVSTADLRAPSWGRGSTFFWLSLKTLDLSGFCD